VEGRVDAITFTSASTVQNFAQAIAGDGQSPAELVGRTPLIAIGPVTAEAAAALGLAIHSVAAEHTIPGLVATMEKFWSHEDA
jgi:uroporphyrinogen III methyltransferase/synthase